MDNHLQHPRRYHPRMSKKKGDKHDCRGVLLSWRENQEAMIMKLKKEEAEQIEKIVTYLNQRGVLVDQFFHFAHFNYAVATYEKQYPPVEVAIVKYSLANGILDEYHQFIEPGKLPMSYAYPAILHSKETHKIPYCGFELANANYVEITNALKKIIRQSDGSLAPIYFLESEIPKAKFILKWLVDKSTQIDPKYESTNPFRAYSLNKLFFELRRHANLDDRRLQFTNPVLVARKLSSGSFDYCPDMGCQWHEEEDNPKYCALSIVRNYAYIISDMCCEHYGLKLLPKRHLPASVADESKYMVKPPTTQQKLDNEVSTDLNSSIESFPRIPRSFGTVVASRLAARFGMGRGLLDSSESSAVIPLESLSTAMSSLTVGASPTPSIPPAACGRGRGFLGD